MSAPVSASFQICLTPPTQHAKPLVHSSLVQETEEESIEALLERRTKLIKECETIQGDIRRSSLSGSKQVGSMLKIREALVKRRDALTNEIEERVGYTFMQNQAYDSEKGRDYSIEHASITGDLLTLKIASLKQAGLARLYFLSMDGKVAVAELVIEDGEKDLSEVKIVVGELLTPLHCKIGSGKAIQLDIRREGEVKGTIVFTPKPALLSPSF
jgi:hypothetical protein